MTNLKLTSSIFLIILVAISPFCISTTASAPAYTPTDHFLLACGSSDANPLSNDNRQWEGDAIGRHFSSANAPNASFTSNALGRSQVPYFTARIFTAPFTYTFPLSAGPKLVRLFLYPSTYSDGFNPRDSYFSLVANNYMLFNNFSAYLNSPDPDPDRTSFFSKEFYINIPEKDQSLNLTFNPNHNSLGFVNGIEIISVPDVLYRNEQVFYKDSDNFIEVVKNETAMELVHRFNIGGMDIPANSDTGMFRPWLQDIRYLSGYTVGLTPQRDNINISYTDTTPAYTAPVAVYTSSRTMGREPTENLKTNLTWVFSVDAGFMYIMRLHFCEFQLEVVTDNHRVFSIYINGQLTWEQMDVFREAGGGFIPIYRDYAVLIPGKRRLVDLVLELHPYIEYKPRMYDAILNGLEIFKVNDSHGSLAGVNPDLSVANPVPLPPKEESRKKGTSVKHKLIVGCVIGSVLLGFLLVCFLIFLRRRASKRWKDRQQSGYKTTNSSWIPFTLTSKASTNNRSSSKSTLPSDICRRFTFEDIRTATGNFDSNFIIGSGGFGNVYRGYIDQGTIAVAIKRLNPTSKQGVHEFKTEIEMLSKLRHLHLVSLIGYSDDNGEMVLVYDYMSNGTLREHLYGGHKITLLSWNKRLEVCIGAARGVEYLHKGAKHSIIHRDIKSTNILLDDNFVAKVSDFGLSKTGPGDKTHVSTAVKGSFGYVDPEYFRRQQLTEKSDVYSFGVVLLEVVSGRAAVVMGLPKEQVSLAEWGRRAYKRNRVEEIVDVNIKGEIGEKCLRKYMEVAMGCLAENGNDRPTMGEVVWGLDFALKLQVSTDRVNVMDLEENGDGDMFTMSSDPFSSEETMPFSRIVSSVDDWTRSGSGSVFSEINNPGGR